MGDNATNNDQMEKEQKSHWHVPTITAIFIVCFALLMIAIVYLICIAKVPVKVSNEGLVITFLGVIATFVVVGNFMQSAEIKRETLDKMTEIRQNTISKMAEFRDTMSSDVVDFKNEIKTTVTDFEKNNKEKLDELKTSINNTNSLIDETKKQIKEERNAIDLKFTAAILENNNQQQSRIANTKEELETRISSLANMQADSTSITTRIMLDFLSLIIMMNITQKKLFQEFLKRLPTFEVQYKKNGKTKVDLRDNGFGLTRLYDQQRRRFFEDGDFKKIESISSVRISNKEKIEDVLNAYDLYNKILTYTMQSAKTSGEIINIEGSFDENKQDQDDNKDNEGNFQE